jgi:hypothetical protein
LVSEGPRLSLHVIAWLRARCGMQTPPDWIPGLIWRRDDGAHPAIAGV